MDHEALKNLHKQLTIWLQNPAVKDLLSFPGLSYIRSLETHEDATGNSSCSECGMQVKTIRELRGCLWTLYKLCNPKETGNGERPSTE